MLVSSLGALGLGRWRTALGPAAQQHHLAPGICPGTCSRCDLASQAPSCLCRTMATANFSGAG